MCCSDFGTGLYFCSLYISAICHNTGDEITNVYSGQFNKFLSFVTLNGYDYQ